MKKRSSYLVSLVIAMVAGAMVLSPYLLGVAHASPPSIPPSVVIAVGYADTENRSSAGSCPNNSCFPSPWCGSAGVQFIGSSTDYSGNPTDTSNCMGGDWDTGAILVTNSGTASITLTNLTVVLPLPASGDAGSPYCPEPPRPITFMLWFGQQYYFGNKSTPAYDGGQITIPAGGQTIFAGTSSDGSYTCPTGNYPSSPPKASYDFDASDANFLRGCTSSNDTASDPQITFSAIGYSPTTYIDNGHVIDTGGIDVGNCAPTAADPQWGHEYLGWRLVNSTCGESCPTNQLRAPTAASSSTSSSTSSSSAQSSSSTSLTSSSSLQGVSSTTIASPPSTTSSSSTLSSSATGISSTLEYGVAAVIVVIIVIAAIGYMAMRRGRRP